ncbi:hypothetical protein [Aliidiomarina soli]|uniref:Porin domain-containing protein n=1 Tax=Aliidiomarina soli TaxID=1928574 RepID=A0A432WHQ8_9GAMM|nr:hypothetical protein [Aliidiomarina soli]RUO33356.1 hypothetical protein CWE14_09090 [Aliidiomarina soli]
MQRVFKLGLLSGLMLAGSAAHANIEWSGFANIGAGFTTGSDEQAFGYEDSVDFKPDTLFALQGRAQLADDLSITTQLMSRGEDNFDLGVEWAYLQYQLNEAWTINAGKLRLPLYNYSDSLDVAYSYHWLRTPQAVYRVPFDNFTGASVQHNAFLGDSMLSTQFIVGNFNDSVEVADSQAETDLENLVGVSSSLNYHSWTVRGGFFYSSDVSVELQTPEFNGLMMQLSGADFASLADDLRVDEREGTFASIGLNFDNFDWVFASEYTELEVQDSFLAKQRSFYASLGKRFGSWMPHVTYAGTRDQQADFALATLPEPLAQGVQQLTSSTTQRSNMTSLGLRYDVRAGVAFKFDVTHVDDKALDTRSNVVSFSVQTVF